MRDARALEADAPVKKSDTKRQAILDTAYRLFRTQGFERTSVAEITAAVGGSKATIYSHFPSKEELFVECMMAAAENYMAGTLKHLDSSGADAAVTLFEFGRSFLTFICSPEQDKCAAQPRFRIHVRVYGIRHAAPG
jgi:AcrR family transcriptional regulator